MEKTQRGKIIVGKYNGCADILTDGNEKMKNAYSGAGSVDRLGKEASFMAGRWMGT
jgi:hypothetical protein